MLQLLAQTSSDYLYETTYATPDETGAALLSGPLLIGILLLAVLSILGMWKVFSKAGQPGWAAIVPFYNLYIMTKVAGKEWWWMLLMLIPYVGIVFQLILSADIAKRFGKSGVWGVFMLGFLSFIGYPMLGFGSAQYQGGSTPNASPTAGGTSGSGPTDAGTPTGGSAGGPTTPTPIV